MLCGRALWEVRITGTGCPGHVPREAAMPVHRAEGTPDKAGLLAPSWFLRSLPAWPCLRRADHPDPETKEITEAPPCLQPCLPLASQDLCLLCSCMCTHVSVYMYTCVGLSVIGKRALPWPEFIGVTCTCTSLSCVIPLAAEWHLCYPCCFECWPLSSSRLSAACWAPPGTADSSHQLPEWAAADACLVGTYFSGIACVSGSKNSSCLSTFSQIHMWLMTTASCN